MQPRKILSLPCPPPSALLQPAQHRQQFFLFSFPSCPTIRRNSWKLAYHTHGQNPPCGGMFMCVSGETWGEISPGSSGDRHAHRRHPPAPAITDATAHLSPSTEGLARQQHPWSGQGKISPGPDKAQDRRLSSPHRRAQSVVCVPKA